MQEAVKISEVGITLILGVIGFRPAHRYRRKIALSVAERRMTAYSALRGKTNLASPARLSECRNESLKPEEREYLLNDVIQRYNEFVFGVIDYE